MPGPGNRDPALSRLFGPQRQQKQSPPPPPAGAGAGGGARPPGRGGGGAGRAHPGSGPAKGACAAPQRVGSSEPAGGRGRDAAGTGARPEGRDQRRRRARARSPAGRSSSQSRRILVLAVPQATVLLCVPRLASSGTSPPATDGLFPLTPGYLRHSRPSCIPSPNTAHIASHLPSLCRERGEVLGPKTGHLVTKPSQQPTPKQHVSQQVEDP